MSIESPAAPVISGLPDSVVAVNHRPPHTLEDLLVGESVLVEATAHGQLVTFQGSARREADAVLVYEKERAGVGRDVRVWEITGQGGRFAPVERAFTRVVRKVKDVVMAPRDFVRLIKLLEEDRNKE